MIQPSKMAKLAKKRPNPLITSFEKQDVDLGKVKNPAVDVSLRKDGKPLKKKK